SDPTQIYWSVITNKKYRTELSDEARQQFIASGAASVDKVKGIFDRWWQGTSRPVVMDFGCGVGRLGVHATEFAEKLYYVDFSAAHLEEATRNLAEFGTGESQGILLENLDTLDTLPACDLVFSLIVLQHNSPPVIAHITTRLLECLSPGGVAVLHVPLASPNYQFDPQSYLADPRSGRGMEMHILPKNNLNEIAEKTGCDVVASHGMGGTRAQYSEWVVFRKSRQGSP
ncbi:MAG: class I SAM-dependent methyltransferase, partial [Rhodobacteraceae bacterium]|nr:class I SAM-dependent methyltransferase [Paracoccaceae bacterium]